MFDIFIDRDGVINRNRHDHVCEWSQFEFLPGVIDAIAGLKRAGCRVFVVTNQAIISRGLVSQDAVTEIHERMTSVMSLHGAMVDSVLTCSHAPEDDCPCRKPRPGLLFHARDRFGADLSAAYSIGDHITDIQAALAAGVKPILVRTGRGAGCSEATAAAYPGQFQVVDDLACAVHLILAATSRTAAVSLGAVARTTSPVRAW